MVLDNVIPILIPEIGRPFGGPFTLATDPGRLLPALVAEEDLEHDGIIYRCGDPAFLQRDVRLAEGTGVFVLLRREPPDVGSARRVRPGAAAMDRRVGTGRSRAHVLVKPAEAARPVTATLPAHARPVEPDLATRWARTRIAAFIVTVTSGFLPPGNLYLSELLIWISGIPF